MSAQFPLINGTPYSWASIKCSLAWNGGGAGNDVTDDIASIEWSEKIERGVLRGRGQVARGRTAGAYEASGKLGLWCHAAVAFKAALMAASANQLRKGFANVYFDIEIQCEESQGVISTTLHQCAINSAGWSSDSGSTDGIKEEFELSVGWVTQVSATGVELQMIQ